MTKRPATSQIAGRRSHKCPGRSVRLADCAFARDSAPCYLAAFAFVIEVATICQVPPLRDHTCRL